MRLISLSIQDLYGTLNLSLRFFNDLNLLVGINGSGKTSALSVIDWLLTPNFGKLATQDYCQLQLNLEINDNDYTIIAERSAVEVLIKVECAHDQFSPISMKVDPKEPGGGR